MGKSIVRCPDCGSENLIETPGQCLATYFVACAYADGETERKMQQAIELLTAAAKGLPFREDLEQAVRLLREADAELVGY